MAESIFDLSELLVAAGEETIPLGEEIFAPPLPFRVPEQKKEEWCWAAVCTGLRSFYDGMDLDQCQIASEVLGGDCCANADLCNQPQFLSTILKDLGYRAGVKGQVPFVVVQTELAAGHPLCCFIDHGAIGHFIVISACDADKQEVGIVDPAPGQPHDEPRMIPLDSFKITYNDGVWRETYLTQRSTA
jgi:hypothetical protein